MNYFPLMNILPIELVFKIYQIIHKENAINLIKKNFRYIKLKQDYISEIIISTLYNANIYDQKVRLLLLPDTIDKLQFIVDNRFSLTYRRNFWLHLLSEMSYVLMHMHNQICIYSKNNYSYSYYQNLKKSISLWFKLCQNYNIKLKVYYRLTKFRQKNKSHDIWCRHKSKMNNFHPFYQTPLVLDNYNIPICINRYLSRSILQSYLSI